MGPYTSLGGSGLCFLVPHILKTLLFDQLGYMMDPEALAEAEMVDVQTQALT
jgi:hypothetical protein